MREASLRDSWRQSAPPEITGALLGTICVCLVGVSISSKILVYSLLRKQTNGVAVRLGPLLAALGTKNNLNGPQDSLTNRHFVAPPKTKRNMLTIFIETQNIL